MSFITDLIIYAHDGRGLGHVSRSVAIGLAVRRLFPEMSVLLLTGSRSVAELVGKGDLDWIKLPAYRTVVSNGISAGAMGPSNIDDQVLGEMRARSIRDILEIYRPKVFLADHTPQGKHSELLPSHDVSPETTRVLGVRAVVGDVDKVWSDSSAEVFRKSYSNILWYGDSSVTGRGEIAALSRCYGASPHETGYVSRLSEIDRIQPLCISDKPLAGVISVPWSGSGTLNMLGKLGEVLKRIGPEYGLWKIYTDLYKPEAAEIESLFSGVEHVRLVQLGTGFLDDLSRSRAAVIYGGYNSLTDVMVSRVPSVVLLRGMKDGEQEQHARLLARSSSFVSEVFPDAGVGADDLEQALRTCLEQRNGTDSVNLDGAANAARFLADLVGEAAC
ncbi:hypothetical protein [Maridesulfovibrio sp.]|uniref:hypothetical protein n=1 Tax=Maridesulfovibrio sp. TaxID=2795000 RepID=UPI002A1871B2|nr:hypothetical protein [Maridesulfovibrio sp.]